MFSINTRSLKLLILLFSCVSLIHGYRKRENIKEANESPSDSEKDTQSTESTLVKDIETIEKDEKKLLKDTLEELEKDKSELESTDENVSEKEFEKEAEEEEKEMVKEEEKEMTEEIAKEEKSESDETPKEELSEPISKSISDENEENPSSASPMLVTELSVEKENAPEGAYAVWNTKGKICLLARFEADFLITYPGKGGEEKADIKLNRTGTSKGKCEHTSKSPLFQISWQKYVFTIIFNRTGEESWVVTSMELAYDTSDSLFDRASNAGKKTARSKPLSLFETPMSKSFYCPGEEKVLLYINNNHVVTARLRDIYLQPYGVEDGQFSPAHRCNKVVIDETPYVQDETVPLAVGCTLALITLLVLLGFSFHRAYNAAKVDYNTMG